MHRVDRDRLQRGHWSSEFNKTVGEGDIAAAYSGDTIGMKGQVRAPFRFQGQLWVTTGVREDCEAYRLVPIGEFAGTARTYQETVADAQAARDNPDGFYHGVKVRHQKREFVLQGPPARFVAGDVRPAAGQMELFPD